MYGVVYVFFIFMLLGGVVVEMFNDNCKIYNWYMNKIVIFLGYFYIKWGNMDKGVVDKFRKLIIIFGGVLFRLLRMVIDSICFSSKYKF